ncbi:MAG: glycosyltransferase family 4 protein [Lachnospiraceae bacterium]|jgi:glycosyltransferase involved in cell wall biosynthesis|nr:glycosyltransferase family 4 protein [Lachnospiraceae bacterium]
MKVLVIGPSPYKSKGGMATVIKGMADDYELNLKCEIGIHASYIDGSIIKRLAYSVYAFLDFLSKYRRYIVFHIHMASYGSTFRKGYYIRFLKKKHKKIILHVHGAEYLQFYNGLSGKKKEVVRDIWARADAIIVLSEQWKREFEKIFNHSHIIVIHNGIDTEQFEQVKSEIVQNRTSFLLLGRLGKRKGVYDIIKAVKAVKETHPNIKVFMAGDGEVERVKQKIIEEGVADNIDVVGWIDFNNKIELLKKVIAVILPSYNEGLPMAILEGMAAGKTIISTNVGGIPEVVSDGENGILIEPGDILGLKEALIKVIENDEFRKKCFRENIKKIDNNYSQRHMHDMLSDLFETYAAKENGE